MLEAFLWLGTVLILLWAIFIVGVVIADKQCDPSERMGVFLAIFAGAFMLPTIVFGAIYEYVMELLPNRDPERRT